MNKNHSENTAIEIVETQEESEEDDEMIFTLFANEKLVSWTKTLLYSFLEEIHTAHAKKRKGYGRKLLAHIEKKAKALYYLSYYPSNFCSFIATCSTYEPLLNSLRRYKVC
jgi:GNAT superfamily N-acetyltransferase